METTDRNPAARPGSGAHLRLVEEAPEMAAPVKRRNKQADTDTTVSGGAERALDDIQQAYDRKANAERVFSDAKAARMTAVGAAMETFTSEMEGHRNPTKAKAPVAVDAIVTAWDSYLTTKADHAAKVKAAKEKFDAAEEEFERSIKESRQLKLPGV